MKTNKTNNRLVMLAAGLTGLALAGCCSEHGKQSAYYSSPPQGYGGTAEQTETTTQQTVSSQNVAGPGSTVIPLYKESVSVGKQDVDAGTVRIKKIVKTETVNQPVELRHEEVVIDREPASGQSSDMSQAFQGGETVIHLTRELPVIQKQTMSAGQIVVQKKSSTEQQNIQSQVRSDDVAVVKEGNPQNVTIGQDVQQSSDATGAAESPGGQAQGGAYSSSGTITDPMALKNASDPSSFDGRQVEFSNCKVQNVMGDNVVMLTTDQGQSFYAYSSQGASSLKPGDKVTVSGTVRAGNGSAQLSGQAAQVLGSQPMYIDAQKIEAAQ